MQELDFKSLDEEQRKVVDEFILMIEQKAYVRNDFDYRRWQMDLAVKQQFLDQAVSSRDYLNYGLSADVIKSLIGADSYNDITKDDYDFYSDLYLPYIIRFFRAYLVNMSNLCFPANGDWLDLSRGFSQYFYQTGVEKFLPYVNDGWVDIIKTENQRFSTKDKYKTSMAELILYGNTVLGHNYNPEHHFIEPFTPGIGTAAIYPISHDWRKSNLVLYYDMTYGELSSRSDFDQDIISEIMPQMTGDDATSTSRLGSTGMKQRYQDKPTFGKVRVYDLFIPSLYAKGRDGECFTARNVYLTVLFKPFKKPNSELEDHKVYILKATQNVSSVDHGILLGAFSTMMPGTFYQQGPLQPFLPHQYTANQFISEISRSVGMVTDAPKSFNPINGGIFDPFETPQPVFDAGAEYTNVKVDMLLDPNSVAAALNVFLAFINYFDKVFEEGTGISKAQLGTMHQGRKTATEVKESYSGSQLNIVEAAGRFDEQILRPSIVCRISATQQVLQEQIKKAVIESVQSDNPQILNEENAYEMSLAQNRLFNRLLNYSGIEEEYREFYKRTMSDFIDDQALFQEVEEMAKQVAMALQFADSPIPPPPQVPQIEGPDGRAIPTKEEIQGLVAGWYQDEQAKREQARVQAKQLDIEIKRKELMFKDTKEPPKPSKKLFYEMLVAPIADSDIVVTGSMTTVSKSLARENMLDMLNALRLFPPQVLEEVDFDGILMLLARSNDLSIRDLKKSEAQILREEEAAQKQAEFEHQLQIQASQNPGAQPPLIPK